MSINFDDLLQRIQQSEMDEQTLWQCLHQIQFCDETAWITTIENHAVWLSQQASIIRRKAEKRIKQLRAHPHLSAKQQLLQEYNLSQEQGITMMAIAEAIIRIPDKNTADLFLNDLLNQQHFHQAKQHFDGWYAHLSNKALKLAEDFSQSHQQDFNHLHGLIKQLGMTVVRSLVQKMVGLLAEEFVIAADIEKAIKKSETLLSKNHQGDAKHLFSFDCLGEAALSEQEATDYFQLYLHSIKALEHAHNEQKAVSIKLSALHPQYNSQHFQQCSPILLHQCKQLCLAAKQVGVAITFDAEESDRLHLSLLLFKQLLLDEQLVNFNGFGFAVQAYNKVAIVAIELLSHWAKHHRHIISIRLVKGAYWDSEIKWAQQRKLCDYPVFTEKAHVDLYYLFCAHHMLQNPQIFSQFATHNLFSISAIEQIAQKNNQYEFQRLYGMGQQLYHFVNYLVECIAH